MMELSYFLFWWDKNINLRLKKKKKKTSKLLLELLKESQVVFDFLKVIWKNYKIKNDFVFNLSPKIL